MLLHERMKIIGPGDRPRFGAWLLRAGVVMACMAGFLVLFLWFRAPAPEVPIPENIDQFDPQLRDYVREKVEWVQQKPRSAERHATLGLVYAANELWAEARIAFMNAARLDSGKPLAQLYVAVAALELGDLDEATRLLKDLTVNFPQFAPGFYRLGEMLLRGGQAEDAELAFARLIALKPDEWRGYAGLGEAKLRKGEYTTAAKLLERAIELEPEAGNARNQLGMAYRALGRMDEAKLELSLGLRQKSFPMPDAWSQKAPQHMRLLHDQLEIANALSAAEMHSKAIALLEKALHYHPDNLALLNNLAIIHNRSGNPERALPFIEKAIQLNDRYLPAHITLAYCYQAMGMGAKAMAAAERAVALSPTTAQAHVAMANALLSLERDAEALSALETAFNHDPKNAELRMEMGDLCWLNLNRPAEALDHYRAATNLNPILVPAYVRLADYHLRQGDTNAARPAIDLLRRIDPGLVELPMIEARWRKVARQNQ
jgi:tetratricopeptide (TPR) repeat protein